MLTCPQAAVEHRDAPGGRTGCESGRSGSLPAKRRRAGARTATSGRTELGASSNSCQKAVKMHRKSQNVRERRGENPRPQNAKHGWAFPWLCRGESGAGGSGTGGGAVWERGAIYKEKGRHSLPAGLQPPGEAGSGGCWRHRSAPAAAAGQRGGSGGRRLWEQREPDTLPAGPGGSRRRRQVSLGTARPGGAAVPRSARRDTCPSPPRFQTSPRVAASPLPYRLCKGRGTPSAPPPCPVPPAAGRVGVRRWPRQAAGAGRAAGGGAGRPRGPWRPRRGRSGRRGCPGCGH